jgi:hypothetical protein
MKSTISYNHYKLKRKVPHRDLEVGIIQGSGSKLNIFCGAGYGTQGLMHTKKVLYH